MSTDWQAYQLNELCDFTNGFAFKSTDYVEKSKDTIEVFRMGYICRGGGFKEDSTPVFVPRAYGKSLEKYILNTGDVVIAMTDMKDKVAILGNTARIRHNNRFALNQRVGCIRVKRHDLLCPDFLYFYSNSLPHVDYLRSRANSGVQVNLSTSAIKESQLVIPPLAEQKYIASILIALDDRITLLRETNATLEGIAQALFKSWFVDFDPVRAKMQGRAPEGMDEATAALFPDSLEQSELGLVPTGWRVSELGDHTCYLSRGISPKYIENGGIAVINQKCIRDFSVDLSKARRHDTEQRKTDGRELCRGDILVNSTGVGTLGRVAQILSLEQPAIVDSHVTVMRADASITWNYLGLSIMMRQSEIEDMGEGSTGQTELSRSKLAKLKLLISPKVILQVFDDAIVPLREKFSTNQIQGQTLATLRDTLLPRLISGALRLDAVA